MTGRLDTADRLVVVGAGLTEVVGDEQFGKHGGKTMTGRPDTVGRIRAVVTGGRWPGRLHAFGGQRRRADRVLKLMSVPAGAASARWWAITAPSNTAAIPNAPTARHHRGVDSLGGG